MTTAELLHQRLNQSGKSSPVILSGFQRRDLAHIFRDFGLLRGAEVGVADGRHSLILCEEIPGLDLLCVDPWLKYRGNPRGGPQEQHDGNYGKAQARLAPYKASLWKAKSMDAVAKVPDGFLDFCYIDGNHSFDYVMPDIIEWGRRVRVDGIIAGHDYYPFKWAGVIEAVTAYTAAHGIGEYFVSDEKEPTWFFAKGVEQFPRRGW
jgi:hypothetical protein